MTIHTTVATEPSPSLVLVTTASEVRENGRRFNRESVPSSERVAKLLAQTTYWVFDPDSGTFAPSKFVGYRAMSLRRYERLVLGDAEGARFDGSVSRQAIESVLGRFVLQPDLHARLVDWVETILGPGATATWDASKWRFVSMPATRCWSVVANPDRFNAAQALEDLAELAWAIGKRTDVPMPGDSVLIWQAKGKAGRRGVIGLGLVTRGPEVEPSPAAERGYWTGLEIAAEPRIRFSVIPCDGLPLWESDHPWLSELKAARATGGTLFSLTREEWDRILALVSNDSEPSADDDAPTASATPRRGGQGRGLSAAQRTAVELHAQGTVEDHFIERGYDVQDVSKTRSYDLHARRGNEQYHIECKGTTGSGGTVILTKNEVIHARTHRENMVLAIVSEIVLTGPAEHPTASGGKMRLIMPWDVDRGVLTPTEYEYLPEAEDK